MSLAYIRQHYGIPAWHGRRVRYTGGPAPQDGTIVGASGAHLLIRIDGAKHPLPYHPTWELQYLPAGRTEAGS